MQLFFISCGSTDKLESFGLPKIDIIMEADEISKYESALTEKIEVHGEIKHGSSLDKAKFAISGKSSLEYPKRSFKVRLSKGSYEGMKYFRLSAQGSDPSTLRSLIGFQLFRDQGLPTPRQFPIALYLNQKYIGLYQVIEEVNEDFYRKRGMHARQIYKARYGRLGHANFDLKNINDLSKGFKIIAGKDAYDPIEEIIETIHKDDFKIEDIEAILDVDNYLNYLAIASYLNHYDGFKNNFFLFVNNQKAGITPWDLDHILEDGNYSNGAYRGQNTLSAKLLEFPDIHEKYKNILRTLLTPEKLASLKEQILAHKNRIEAAYKADTILSEENLDLETQGIIDSLDGWHNGMAKELSEE